MAPTIWQAVIPSTGEVIAIVRTADEAAAIAPERWGTVYTLAEIAIALDAFGDDVRAVKVKFPDSAVTAVRPSGLNIGAAIQMQSQAARGDPGKGLHRPGRVKSRQRACWTPSNQFRSQNRIWTRLIGAMATTFHSERSSNGNA